jgi:peptide chain release factor 3
LHLFANQGKGSAKAVEHITGAEDPRISKLLHPDMHREWLEQIELLSLAGEQFDDEKIRQGELTPVFFGSGINNFGVQLLLNYFVEHGTAPMPRKSSQGLMQPDHPDFSAFVFKIQANMDPNHRDSLSFIRICSGIFEKDMTVPNPRGGRPLRLSYPQRLFGQDRESVECAYPGDIVGLVSHGNFRIGDTLTNIPNLVYNEIPRFPPEVFSYLHNSSPSRYKQFQEGLEQLLNEGVIQVFYIHNSLQKTALLGAVGQLQFEVVKHRLETEYSADVRLEEAPFTQVRWLPIDTDPDSFDGIYLGSNVRLAQDPARSWVILFPDEWAVNYFQEKNPKFPLLKYSPLQGDTI